VYTSPHDRCFDVTQVNYYTPRLSRYGRVPGRHAGGRRRWAPDQQHWEQRPAPEHLGTYLRACEEADTDIWILENGLCNPVVDGTAHPRPDGWDRPTYLKAHLAAVVDAIDAGARVTSYYNWALFDNYQWGEYESCFGLYGVNRDSGCKFLDTDSMGHDSAAALRTIIDGLRAGDRSVLT
jgi:beta-glucosidase/6-phospho-beta-glucosidase/beta-galactosidase